MFRICLDKNSDADNDKGNMLMMSDDDVQDDDDSIVMMNIEASGPKIKFYMVLI